jgi:hypothetical protein
MTEQYERVENEELKAAFESSDVFRGVGMLLANMATASALDQLHGTPYTPEFRDAGWTLGFQTPRGIIMLWSCWLRDQFVLSTPASIVAVTPCFFDLLKIVEPEVVDPSLPTVRILRTPSNPPSSRSFRTIEDTVDGSYQMYKFEAHGLDTFFTVFTDPYPSEFVSVVPDAIQLFRDKFIQLALNIADAVGGVSVLHVNMDFTVIPESVGSIGFNPSVWVRGTPGQRQGWGRDLVYATHKENNEVLMLESANSLVPWTTTRRIPVANLTLERVLGYLTF